MYLKKYSSPIGGLILCDEKNALKAVWFCGQKHAPAELAKLPFNDTPCLLKAEHWLDCYFSGRPLPEMPDLLWEGTPFALTIRRILSEIPYGTTRTYKEVATEAAHRMGKEKMSAQAVGQAVGKNPIAIFIPCHRVIGSDGKLTGYAAGTDKKNYLLHLESKGRANADTQ